MKSIILVGSHGTGKTTLLKAYKDKYGMSIRDGISRPIHKCTKELGLSRHDEQKLINELTFFYWDYNKDIPNLGMTRSPLDCMVYSQVFGFEDLQKECVQRFAELDLNDVIFVYVPIEFEIEDDGIRYTDKQLQKYVDESMVYYMNKFNIQYKTVSGSVEERVEQLRSIVENT